MVRIALMGGGGKVESARIRRSGLVGSVVALILLLAAAVPAAAAPRTMFLGSPGGTHGELEALAVSAGQFTFLDVEVRNISKKPINKARLSMGSTTPGGDPYDFPSLPDGATIFSVTPSTGCTFSSAALACQFGKLKAGEWRTVRIVIDTPATGSNVAFWVGLEVNEGSSTPGNTDTFFASGEFDVPSGPVARGWVPSGALLALATDVDDDSNLHTAIEAGGQADSAIAEIIEDESDEACEVEFPEGITCFVGSSEITAFDGELVDGGLRVRLVYQLGCEGEDCPADEDIGMIHILDNDEIVVITEPCNVDLTTDCLRSADFDETTQVVTIEAIWSSNGKGKGFG